LKPRTFRSAKEGRGCCSQIIRVTFTSYSAGDSVTQVDGHPAPPALFCSSGYVKKPLLAVRKVLKALNKSDESFDYLWNRDKSKNPDSSPA